MQTFRLPFFPQNLLSHRCLSCGSSEMGMSIYFCPGCLKSMGRLTWSPSEPRCQRCYALLPSDAYPLCRDCASDPTPLWEDALCLFPYKHVLAQHLLFRLKFDHLVRAAKDLAHLLRPHLLTHLASLSVDTVTVVPSSAQSLRQRGFNPVEAVLDLAGMPWTRTLRRSRHAYKQASLDKKLRMQDIIGQFQIDDDNIAHVTDKHMLLIDDIYTTGSTVKECARILKQSGAFRVSVLCFFRAD